MLSLDPDDVQIIRDILARHVPDRQVWAFGSRATGKDVRQFSDLDLAVEGVLPWGLHGILDDAFDESLLPIKVEIIATGDVDQAFLDRIRKDFAVVQPATAHDRRDAQAPSALSS